MSNDIVYVLRNDIKPDELRYSLRSIVRNFDFRNVVFYGGCPEGIIPDRHVEIIQEGRSKYARTRMMYESIFEDEELTDSFYLFNDDFFILKKYEQDTPIVGGTLAGHAQRIVRKHNRLTNYARRLNEESKWLLKNGYDAYSYETHTPMLIDRGKALSLKKVDHPFRSLYGNICAIGGIIAPDCKIIDMEAGIPEDIPAVSTSDKSFANGEIGRQLRAKFSRRCRFEAK